MTGKDSDGDQQNPPMKKGEIYYYLRSRLPRDHEVVMGRVAALRRGSGPGPVFAMAMITLSSFCIRDCIYCGNRATQESGAGRFRLTRSQILNSARAAREAGFKMIILKSGVDPGLSTRTVAEFVREIRKSFGFHIALSLGERDQDDYDILRDSGAEVYWLRHETCDPHLYRRIKPTMYWVDRIKSLKAIAEAGFQLGSGIMIGMPNQSYESLVEDILLFEETPVFGLVIEPFMPPNDSPGHRLIQRPENLIVGSGPATMETVTAMARLVSGNTIIPITNAHAELYNALQKNSLLTAGANAVIFEFTPKEFSCAEATSPFSGVPAADPATLARAMDGFAGRGKKLAFDPPLTGS